MQLPFKRYSIFKDKTQQGEITTLADYEKQISATYRAVYEHNTKKPYDDEVLKDSTKDDARFVADVVHVKTGDRRSFQTSPKYAGFWNTCEALFSEAWHLYEAPKPESKAK